MRQSLDDHYFVPADQNNSLSSATPSPCCEAAIHTRAYSEPETLPLKVKELLRGERGLLQPAEDSAEQPLQKTFLTSQAASGHRNT